MEFNLTGQASIDTMVSTKSTPAKMGKSASNAHHERGMSPTTAFAPVNTPPRAANLTPTEKSASGGSRKKVTPRKWDYNHIPIGPEMRARNGRMAGRNLITWTRKFTPCSPC